MSDKDGVIRRALALAPRCAYNPKRKPSERLLAEAVQELHKRWKLCEREAEQRTMALANRGEKT